MLRYILNVGAGRQDERPGQAEVGEQRLALLGKQRLAVTEQRQCNVAQGQAHHAAAGRVGADQTAQAGLRRHDRVPRLPRQPVAAAVAAGGRIADAARGDQRVFCPQRLAAVRHCTLADAVLDDQLFCAAAHKFRIACIIAQRGQHVGGAVTPGKYPPPALGFERHAERLEQLHGRRRRESVKARIQKPPVMPHIGQKLPHVAVACDVAASLSGDKQLLARSLGVVLQHGHGQPAGTGGPGCHQARRAAADDQ